MQEVSHERLDERGPELVRVRVRGLGAQGLHEPACQARPGRGGTYVPGGGGPSRAGSLLTLEHPTLRMYSNYSLEPAHA